MPKNWKDLLAKLPVRRRTRVARGTAGLAAESRLPTHRPPTHPGEMLLEEFLKPLNLSPEVFARRIRVPAGQIFRLIRTEESISADLALRLAKVLGTNAEFWLNLQLDWDLWHALRSPAAKTIAKLRPLHPPTKAPTRSNGK